MTLRRNAPKHEENSTNWDRITNHNRRYFSPAIVLMSMSIITAIEYRVIRQAFMEQI